MAPEIVVKYYGPVKNIVGRREEVITVCSGERVKDILIKLGRKYGLAFQDTILAYDDAVHRNVRLVLSGKDVDEPIGLNTQVEAGDELKIVVLIPVAGG